MENQNPQDEAMATGLSTDVRPFAVTSPPTPQNVPRGSFFGRLRPSWGFSRGTIVVAICIVIVAAGAYALKVRNDRQTSQASLQPSDNFSVQDIPLKGLSSEDIKGLSTLQSLSINGQLRANNSLIITPGARPEKGELGQIYFDEEGNTLAYYDGEDFVNFANNNDIEDLQGQTTELQDQLSSLEESLFAEIDFLAEDMATLSGDNFFTGFNTFEAPSEFLDGVSTTDITASGATLLQGALTVDDVALLNSDLTVGGTTSLGPTTASSLVLSSPLSVGSGGTGASNLASNGILIGQGTSPVTTVTAGAAGLCLVSTAGAPTFQACPGGGGATVDSLNSLTGSLSIANASGAGTVITIDDASTAAKGIASFNSTNFSVSGGAVNTIQNIATTSTPSFAGITLSDNLALGANSITTSGATISSGELDVLDNGIAEGEVTGVITDITAGTGLTGGAGSGNATVNVVSANGAIAVNTDNIALTLQPSGDGLSSSTSSGSGLEVLAGGLALLQGCSDGQLLKWNETTDTWGCATDAGSGGLGDDVTVNGSGATGANFIDTVASGTTAGVVWGLNTTPSPDDISLTISNASATTAGVVTTGVQSFAGNKTYNDALTVSGLFTANGNFALETGDTFTINGEAFTDLTGTGLSFAGGLLQTSLGIAIDSSEITDLTVVGADIANDTITDTQLAFNTGQHLTTLSTPSFAGITLTGNLALGANSITTSGATIGSGELDLLDNGIDESEVTGVITDVTAGIGLTGGTGSGNATLSLDYTNTLASNSLGVNQSSFAAGGILFEGAAADSFETLFTLVDPTADNTITIPNASGTICLSTGNCAGAGGGVTTAGGSTNRLAKFSGAQAISDSTITDDGTNVTTSANMIIQGGNVTAGTNSQLGSFILNDGSGQTTTLRAGNSVGDLTFILPTNAGSQYQCLKYDTAGQLIWDDCSGGGGGGSGVTSLNSLSGSLTIQGNSQIGVTPSSPNISLSINSDSIGDTQLAFNTGQHLTAASTPTFAGITLNGDLSVGANNIVTSLATISSAELNVIDAGIDESEVTGVVTDVTAGSGLTGGASSGNATINIASANGAIAVNADNIALTLQPSGDGLSASTSSGSGLEILGGGLTLLQGCGDGQTLKWNETADTWGCATDTDSDSGDEVAINGSSSSGVNFIDSAASGTAPSVSWSLNSTPSPDEVTLTIGSASATEAGVVTTGVQSFAGDKTFSNAAIITGLFTANGGITVEAGDTFTFNGDAFTDLTGTGLVVVGNALQASLGVAIDSSEITDLTITGADIANDTITDTQLAFNTGQHLTTSSTPSFAGITLTGDLALGSNNITTSGATISSAELDVLDSGIDESEVTGVITDVTAGTGLTGGAGSGNATVNVASANGGIVVGADNISLTLQGSSDGLSSTTSSGSGLEILSSGLTLLQGCSDGEVLKWNEATDAWSCAVDAGGSGLGDDISVNGTGATNANFVDTAASGTTAGVAWSINTTPSPDEISLTISNASATQAGVITTGTQSFAGDKTFNNAAVVTGLFTANGGVTIETGDALTLNGDAFTDLTGTGLTIAAGVLQSTLGVAIDSSEITDLTITGADIANDTITDAQLAFNTGQHLTTSSTPSFAGITLTGTLALGVNSITTNATTISSGELDVLDGGVAEGEVTGVITDVTAGSGLTGGAASGNATVNIASANGGIVVNADNIALTLQPAGDGLSSTTSSGSGLEILATGFSLLQGCADNQILKWNETTDVWACGDDAGGSGLGDDVYVNSTTASNANFINSAASGTAASITWNLNTTPSPDEITIAIGNASATEAGTVTTGTQTFAGAKTFNGQITAGGGINLGALTLQGTSAAIDFTNFDVLSNGSTTVGGTLTVTNTSTFNESVTVSAGKSLTLTGSSTRPVSPSNGMLYYDTTTQQLLVYGNGKWQADKSSAIIIAASNSSQADKDAADYITNGDTVAAGDGDQVEIQQALNAANPASSGRKTSRVVLLAGTYTVDATILIPNNTTLTGVGEATIIELAEIDTTDNLIENSDTSSGAGVSVRDLRINGRDDVNNLGTQRGIYLNGMGDVATARTGAKITNVSVLNFRNAAIYLNNSDNSSVTDSKTQGNDEGILLDASNYNNVSGNNSDGDSDGIILYTNSTNNSVVNNKVQNSGGVGIYIWNSANHNLINGNTVSNTSDIGIQAFGSTSNTITGNTSHGNGSHGISINTGVTSTIVSNNTTYNNVTSGIYIYHSSTTGNTITSNTSRNDEIAIYSDSAAGNTISNNTLNDSRDIGILLSGGSGSSVNANRISNSGGATTNDAIVVQSSDANNLTSNTITDTSATSNNYSIQITDAGSDTNYLSNNTLGTGSINNLGTGTILGGQVNASGNLTLQPTGTIELLKNTNVTGTLNVTSNVDTNGSLTVGTADQFVVSSSGIVTTGVWNGTDIAIADGGTGASTSQAAINNLSQLTTNGDILFHNGTNSTRLARGSDGQCLLSNTTTITWASCTPTTLQGSYNGSSPATIDLSNNKDFTINATEQTTDSSIVFNLQCTTCSTDGGRFAIQDAGTDIFRVNPNGDIVIGTATNNMTFVAANSYKPLLSGDARNTKYIRLSAEYPAAVLAADGSNNTGTLTSGYTEASRMNYYNWTTTQGSNQDYDVVVQVPIPLDFDGWNTNPLTISTYSSDLTNGLISLEARDSGGTQRCNFVNITPGQNGTSASTNTWVTGHGSACTLSAGTYTAGDYMTLRVRLQAPNGGNTRVGNIVLSYKSKF